MTELVKIEGAEVYFCERGGDFRIRKGDNGGEYGAAFKIKGD